MRSPAMSGSVPGSETFDEVVDRRLARRSVLKGVLGVAPLLVVGPSVLFSHGAAAASAPHLTFQPIALDDGVEVRVPEGYIAQKFLRWGDPILPGAPAFDFWNQSASAQAGQFGYNCDFLQFFPLPQDRVRNGSHGILAVNHEYTNPELMFADFIAADFEGDNPAVTTQANVDIELAAHGLSLVEVRLDRQSGWELARQSQYNRRITAETWIAITGPAAGHDLLKVSYDPTGTLVRGTLNNCGGGITPWGTLLTAEENFNQYFANRALGQIVARLSRSRYWPETAVFVIEDDAQDGPDHVDARRTVGLVIGPYVKRKLVDSTLYTTSSMLRTIELLLGLPPMSQFDAAAMPMYAAFGIQEVPTPYEPLEPRVDTNELNLATAWGAHDSMLMDLSDIDLAPMRELNEIVWRSEKGADWPMPAPVRAFFFSRPQPVR